jgi:hypothetical protein
LDTLAGAGTLCAALRGFETLKVGYGHYFKCIVRIQECKVTPKEIEQRNKEFYKATATADDDTAQLMRNILASGTTKSK